MTKYIWLLIIVGVLGACKSSKSIVETPVPDPQPPRPEMLTSMDSVSFALGQDLGSNLAKQDIQVNDLALYKGLKAALGDSEPILSDEDIRGLIVKLQQDIREKQMKEQEAAMASKSSITPGEPAPEITLPTVEGDMLSLSSLKGKVVLIDFWASWCRPCRMENPNVVKLYNQYKSQGFEILGVSLDRGKDAWVKAIEKDKLTWLHVSDLKFWQSAAAETYGVNAIPYTVLVDKEGNIIAENLRGASLKQKLAEIFGS